VRLISIAFGLVTVGVSARSLGTTDYGVAATLTTVVGVLGFADLGIGQGLLTALSRAKGDEDRPAMHAFVSSAWAALLAAAAIAAGVAVVLWAFVPWQTVLGAQDVPEGEVLASVAVFLVGVVIAIPGSLGHRVLFGLQRGRVAYLWNALGVGCAAVATLTAAWAGASVAWFVAAALLVPAMVALAETAWVLGRAHAELRPRRALVSGSRVRTLASLSGLFLVLNVAVAVAYQTDALVVSAVLGASAAAVYAISLRLFGLVSSLITSATEQMWPALTESWSAGDIEWARSRFLRVLALSTGAVSAGSLILIGLGPWLVNAWVGAEFVPPRSLLVAFGVWTTYSIAASQASVLLTAVGIVRAQAVMAVLMASANLPLSIYFTNEFGLSGPLLGSLTAHVLFAGLPTVVLVSRALRQGGERAQSRL
jgi:O-antigen/teichoic acid export membrane protein